jgi:hypothetical protein
MSDAADLLKDAQYLTREVKPKSLGPIGRHAFADDEGDDEYDGYACKEGVFRYGAHPPYARIPYLVECWASVENRYGRECNFDLMVNRTATTASFYAHRSLRGKTLAISGAEIRLDIEIPTGDCEILVHICSPFVPVHSIGKNPDLSVFRNEIAETIRLAFNYSRNLLPADEKAPKKTPEQKPAPKPKPEPHKPTTRLGMIIEREAATAGIVDLRDLTVLSKDNDPYLLDTAKNHAAGQWFADQIERFVASGKQVHLRGLHYAILSSGDVRKPDGKLYVNNNSCWTWLQRTAAKAARWLDYVPFDRIKDERNEPPRLICPGRVPTGGGKRSLTVDRGAGFPEPPLLETMLPKLAWKSNVKGNQPYRLIFVAEKSSLGDVLEPLAYEFQADLLLGTGDISDTHVAELAARAADDGRPFVVLYFADFDPSGWHMPTVVGRKFQALIDLKYSGLKMQTHRVALKYEQAVEHDLPSTPLKDSDRRKARWKERWGREQTEIDALAALRPDILEQIARDAVKPFYDPTLEKRITEANKLPDDLVQWFEGLESYASAVTAITTAREDAEQAIADLNELREQVIANLEEATKDAADKPELPPIEAIEPANDEVAPEPLFTSEDSFVDATRKLILEKNKGAPEEAEEADGEED